MTVILHKGFSLNNLIQEIFLHVKFAFIFSLNILSNKQKPLNDERHAINNQQRLTMLNAKFHHHLSIYVLWQGKLVKKQIVRLQYKFSGEIKGSKNIGFECLDSRTLRKKRRHIPENAICFSLLACVWKL